MKLFSAATAALYFASSADAFVVAPPSSRVGGFGATRQSTTMVAPLPAAAGAGVTSALQSVVPLIASGVAEPGSVDAPGWVLPLGAFAVILTAGIIPLVLKVSLSREASKHHDTENGFAVRISASSRRLLLSGERWEGLSCVIIRAALSFMLSRCLRAFVFRATTSAIHTITNINSNA